MKNDKFTPFNVAEIARRMGRSRQWFYQRLNGNVMNGKPAAFTEAQMAQIAGILLEISREAGVLARDFCLPCCLIAAGRLSLAN